MKTIDEVLRDVPLFAGLSEDELALLAGCASNVRFDAGATIFRDGDPADTFFLVRHGSVALETHVPGRGAVTIETIEDGDVLGWSWLFPPYRRQFDAVALTQVRATSFDGTCLRGKCAEDVRLGYDLMTRFAQLLIERMHWMRIRLLDVYGDRPAG